MLMLECSLQFMSGLDAEILDLNRATDFSSIPYIECKAIIEGSPLWQDRAIQEEAAKLNFADIMSQAPIRTDTNNLICSMFCYSIHRRLCASIFGPALFFSLVFWNRMQTSTGNSSIDFCDLGTGDGAGGMQTHTFLRTMFALAGSFSQHPLSVQWLAHSGKVPETTCKQMFVLSER